MLEKNVCEMFNLKQVYIQDVFLIIKVNGYENDSNKTIRSRLEFQMSREKIFSDFLEVQDKLNLI